MGYCLIRERVCANCCEVFQMRISIKAILNGKGRYCSNKCKNAANSINFRTGAEKTCLRCRKYFYVSKGNENKYPSHCSRECRYP